MVIYCWRSLSEFQGHYSYQSFITLPTYIFINFGFKNVLLTDTFLSIECVYINSNTVRLK